jgi:response regulator RpfG family c-di-GMP phosphodiesterase
MTPTEPLRIMIIDDEPGVLAALQRLLHRGMASPGRTLVVTCHQDPVAALQRSLERPVDLVLCDYRMPGLDGVSLLAQLARTHPDTARILLTGSPDLKAVLAAVNDAGAVRVLLKPWHPTELLGTVRDCLAARQARLHERQLANQARLAHGELSPQDAERQRLEACWPGITHVEWTDDGAVQMGDTGLAPLDETEGREPLVAPHRR